MKNNINSKSKFNLIFRTTYFSNSKKIRKIYSVSLFTTVILLFIFLILSLVMTFSFNINANYFIKDLPTKDLSALFGDLDKYNEWSNSSTISGTFGNFVSVVGGGTTFADAFGVSAIVTTTSVLSFISVALVLLTIIFKKQTMASYISFTLSATFLLVLIVLFSILISKGSENNNIKTIMELGNKLKETAVPDKISDFTTALTKYSQFLQGLKG